ncbi:MAG: LamG-like jellyroll fold domain-containing protein [Halobacteriota archaeon]|nr:LamG-like jellyroll fold domain-containing protein [Halobacteriota archaeon]
MTSVIGIRPTNPLLCRHPDIPLNLPFIEGSGDTVYDLSGNANNGDVTDGVWSSTSRGWCIIFNGTSSYINCGTDESVLVDQSGWTCESLIYPLSAQQGGVGNRSVVYYAGSGSWWIFIAGNNVRLQQTESPYSWVSTTEDEIQNQNWYHVVITSVDDEKSIYIDGDLLITGDLIVDDANLSRVSFATGDAFDGNMSLVRLYNLSLSEKDVKHAYLDLRRRLRI